MIHRRRATGYLITLLLVLAAIPSVYADSIDYDTLEQSRLEDGGFVLGSPDAPFTVVVFEDFLCPHCQDYNAAVLLPLIETYVVRGQVRLEHRALPVIDPVMSLHLPNVLECADQIAPGSFWPGREQVYALLDDRTLNDRTDPDEATALIAAELDLDTAELTECLDELDAPQVEQDIVLAGQAGALGTPAVYLRGGAGQLKSISFDGDLYDRGGVPLDVFAGLLGD